MDITPVVGKPKAPVQVRAIKLTYEDGATADDLIAAVYQLTDDSNQERDFDIDELADGRLVFTPNDLETGGGTTFVNPNNSPYYFVLIGFDTADKDDRHDIWNLMEASVYEERFGESGKGPNGEPAHAGSFQYSKNANMASILEGLAFVDPEEVRIDGRKVVEVYDTEEGWVVLEDDDWVVKKDADDSQVVVMDNETYRFAYVD